MSHNFVVMTDENVISSPMGIGGLGHSGSLGRGGTNEHWKRGMAVPAFPRDRPTRGKVCQVEGLMSNDGGDKDGQAPAMKNSNYNAKALQMVHK